MREVNLTMIAKEIRKQMTRIKQRKQDGFNFLGFVENNDLSSVVMKLFSITAPTGATYYNWVEGNEKLQEKLKAIKTTKLSYREIEKILKI